MSLFSTVGGIVSPRYSTRWSQILGYITRFRPTPPAFDASVMGVPVGILPWYLVWKKLEWCGYPMVKKFWRCVYSFWQYVRTWQTDTYTRTPHNGIGRACIASRGKNCCMFLYGYRYVGDTDRREMLRDGTFWSRNGLSFWGRYPKGFQKSQILGLNFGHI